MRVVLALLVDDGVPSNDYMFNASWTHTGIFTGPHSLSYYMKNLNYAKL